MAPYPGATSGPLREDALSPSATGVMLLFWQQPTDRALTGWCAYPGMIPGSINADGLVAWLRSKVQISLTETDDQARVVV